LAVGDILRSENDNQTEDEMENGDEGKQTNQAAYHIVEDGK
jgi:hypothetical protein